MARLPAAVVAVIALLGCCTAGRRVLLSNHTTPRELPCRWRVLLTNHAKPAPELPCRWYPTAAEFQARAEVEARAQANVSARVLSGGTALGTCGINPKWTVANVNKRSLNSEPAKELWEAIKATAACQQILNATACSLAPYCDWFAAQQVGNPCVRDRNWSRVLFETCKVSPGRTHFTCQAKYRTQAACAKDRACHWLPQLARSPNDTKLCFSKELNASTSATSYRRDWLPPRLYKGGNYDNGPNFEWTGNCTTNQLNYVSQRYIDSCFDVDYDASLSEAERERQCSLRYCSWRWGEPFDGGADLRWHCTLSEGRLAALRMGPRHNVVKAQLEQCSSAAMMWWGAEACEKYPSLI